MATNILYVDDELDNLTAFKASFRRIYSIDTASSAMEAFELLKHKSYKIIISDQRMPNITGVEFFERIKDAHPDSIRMILTGYADMQSIIDAINKGNIYYYITKPWSRDEFKIVIDRAIETYELREENKALYRSQVMAQFEVLKNQINPHFLFNSMNVLGALIPRDAEKATRFTAQFSKLYRSLLQLKDHHIIRLDEELEFVRSFIDLQMTRFEGSLHVDYHFEDTTKYNIPPFSIQLLIENAIKHNITSESKPLRLTIRQEGDKLIVENNLQKRNIGGDSTGLGLKNLDERYALLKLPPPIIEETATHYRVQLYLIQDI